MRLVRKVASQINSILSRDHGCGTAGLVTLCIASLNILVTLFNFA